MHPASPHPHDAHDAAQPGEAELERALRQCRPELLAYLFSRVNNAEDAEDLTQETCTRLLHYRDDASIDDPRAMLFRIANNVLTDHYRRRERRCAGDHIDIESVVTLQAVDAPHVERIAHREALAALRRVIERLPPKCQLVFMLSRFDGLSNRQISDRMGISVKMVEKHITRALLDCQSAVGEHGARASME